jgi:protease-4
VKWLQAQNKIKGDLPVRDYKLAPRFSDMTFLRATAPAVLESLGLPTVARFVGGNGAASLSEQLQLDGMLALWRPAGAN